MIGIYIIYTFYEINLLIPGIMILRSYWFIKQKVALLVVDERRLGTWRTAKPYNNTITDTKVYSVVTRNNMPAAWGYVGGWEKERDLIPELIC